MIAQIDISKRELDPERAHADFRAALPSGQAGAITAFTGIARADDGVTQLGLSHYEGATQAGIATQLERAGARWPLIGGCIIHRVGLIKPNAPIVFVAMASQHRRASFEAADFMMDYLKSGALFWKYEQRGDDKIWIEPRAQDMSDAARWDTD